MKKSVRIYLTGNMQSMFFKQHMKETADKCKVRGFLRNLEDGRVEIFAEGNIDDVNTFIELSKVGPQFVTIRNFEVKDERFQDAKDFKVLNF